MLYGIDIFSKKKAFFDLDGTVNLGDMPIKGASEFFKSLKEKGLEYFFLSNNTSKVKKQYVDRLAAMNIKCTEQNIILPTDALMQWLITNNIEETFVLGNTAFTSYLQAHGIHTCSQNPQYVVVAFDTELTYQKLQQACLFIQRGIKFVVTNIDLVCPTENGYIPDTGSICQVIETTSGEKPFKIFGKPYKEMIEPHLEKTNTKDVVIIGDRIYTDMQLAKNINCDFILVLSGETKMKDLHKVDYDKWMFVNEIGELVP